MIQMSTSLVQDNQHGSALLPFFIWCDYGYLNKYPFAVIICKIERYNGIWEGIMI